MSANSTEVLPGLIIGTWCTDAKDAAAANVGSAAASGAGAGERPAVIRDFVVSAGDGRKRAKPKVVAADGGSERLGRDPGMFVP